MFVSQLKTFSYRNLKDLSINFSPGLNFISGRNGHGKTNILEALYILSTSKSYRTADLKECSTWGSAGFYISADVSKAVSDTRLELTVDGRKKNFSVNEKRVSSPGDFLGELLCISFFPEDLEIIKGGPAERRRFLDKHIIDLAPRSIDTYRDYNKALKSKNSLLRAGRTNLDLLEPWNQILAETGSKISKLRETACARLQLSADLIHQQFGLSDGNIALNLQSNFCDDVQENLKVLRSAYQKECILKSARVGVHRDELLINHGQIESRSYASQGQTRSLVLSLKIGALRLLEEEFQDSPLILLDDVDSELDSKRKELFYQLLLNSNRQIIITGTEEPELLKLSRSDKRIFLVELGNISDIS